MAWYRMRMDLGGLGGAVFHLNFGRKKTVPPCSVCGYVGTHLCDWKMPGGKDCDRALCGYCTTSPAPGKDLCPAHVAAYKAWLAGRTNSVDGIGH